MSILDKKLKRLTRWMLMFEQPEPLDLGHEAQKDLAWAADEIIELSEKADRLLVLATKHCPKEHHDWQEVLRIAGDA